MGAQESKSSDSKDYIVATYEKSTVLVRRHEGSYYANLLAILHKHFPTVPTELMVIQTNELTICDGRFVDIPEDLWTEVHVPGQKPELLPAYDGLRLKADGTVDIILSVIM
ncbi:hypothetical protein IW261DRAFT_1425607 [Armillaria novae-zelandiae]|uniref:Uncharacterized protein n=1 Tax=Armillaria novae-zelandiae TaxID=153914 RepID=A0AA39U9V2_9AGAR|nr:hypothetical protein IW261DRAFT_1425607 [Armillaria novae-zelandiae]